ncbi:hypothetical protein P7K49_005828 [Saguinus oedipus]|uniref:RING-Gid-type domain-containing protein n=1 Tax=Saguinus oedipus TaxID=9490 RepID=A0ABQ9W0N1_SAGOE|nr:hypothetical protein P7K49_005828 [Saguinus oedipus]
MAAGRWHLPHHGHIFKRFQELQDEPPQHPLPCLFQDLLDPARWRMLIQQFRYDNYRLHQLGNSSVFTLTLQAGLSAIKTPYPAPCAQCGLAWDSRLWSHFNRLTLHLATLVLPPQTAPGARTLHLRTRGTVATGSAHPAALGGPQPFLDLTHRQCYKEDGSSKSPDCPVCSRSLNKLAQPLPMAHCANSRLVCKISGDVMNENNPPMMLPNGYVYGYNSLLSIRQDDKVVCPRTKEVFHFSQAEKVYIM